MKDIYLKLMGDLIGKINLDSPICEEGNKNDYNYRLQESCEQFNRIMIEEKEKKKVLSQKEKEDISFSVGTSAIRPGKILEPCPIYCPKEEEIYRYVFVGLNPYKDKKFKDEGSNFFPQKSTKWIDWVNYNFPTDENTMRKRSIYTHISRNAVGRTKYYDWAFRLHQALFHDKRVFDSWSELVNEAHANNMEIDQFFIKEFWEYPILSAEMIPYKSYSYGVTDNSARRFIKEVKGYKDYLVDLLTFIDNHTNEESIIFFLGHRENVANILWSVKDDISLLPSCDSKKEFTSKYKKSIPNVNPKKGNNYFYFFQYEKDNYMKKVVISPFLHYNGTDIALHQNNLINDIKNGKHFIPNII